MPLPIMPDPFSGFILIDKPYGISSFDVIRSLRRHLGIRRIGHAGTLDPFASGLLVCAVGKYTRLLQFVENQSKTYEAMMILGTKTNTGDPEGVVVQQVDFHLDETKLTQLKSAVLQLSKQQVPAYSAIKIDGKRAYQYARENAELEMPIRDICVYDFEIINIDESTPSQFSLSYRVQVSKGTYIRALSEQIAELLGTVGYTVELRRTAIGRASVTDAIGLDDLQSNKVFLMPARALLSNMPGLELSQTQAQDILHGKTLCMEAPNTEAVALYSSDGNLIGIAEINAGTLKPRIVVA